MRNKPHFKYDVLEKCWKSGPMHCYRGPAGPSYAWYLKEWEVVLPVESFSLGPNGTVNINYDKRYERTS